MAAAELEQEITEETENGGYWVREKPR